MYSLSPEFASQENAPIAHWTMQESTSAFMQTSTLSRVKSNEQFTDVYEFTNILCPCYNIRVINGEMIPLRSHHCLSETTLHLNRFPIRVLPCRCHFNQNTKTSNEHSHTLWNFPPFIQAYQFWHRQYRVEASTTCTHLSWLRMSNSNASHIQEPTTNTDSMTATLGVDANGVAIALETASALSSWERSASSSKESTGTIRSMIGVDLPGSIPTRTSLAWTWLT